MKLSVKTLTNEQFTVEAEETDTVLGLKQKISAERGIEAGLQKLIFAGKVLKDEQTLAEASLKEGSFLVCMATKKPAAAPAPAPAAPAPAPAPAAAPPAPALSSAPAPAARDPFSGPEFDAKVNQLKDMGFVEADIRAALRAAFGNPDRAVEYLMSGIPPGLGSGSGGAPASGAPAAAPSGGRPLDVLRGHPQFNQLKQLIQTNPSALPTVLSQIGAASPQLLTLINANREEFVAMMNEPVDEGDMEDDGGEGEEEGDEMDMEGGPSPAQLAALGSMLASMTPEQQAALAAQMGLPPAQLAMMAQLAAAGGLPGGMGGGAPGAPPPGAHVVRLSTDEAAAVARLEGLGFPRQKVLEAYLACDKNEEMAANYLLEHGFDEA